LKKGWERRKPRYVYPDAVYLYLSNDFLNSAVSVCRTYCGGVSVMMSTPPDLSSRNIVAWSGMTREITRAMYGFPSK
jgi:hypothetical protein